MVLNYLYFQNKKSADQNDNKIIQLKLKSHDLLKKVIKILENFGTSLRIITDIDVNNNNYHHCLNIKNRHIRVT